MTLVITGVVSWIALAWNAPSPKETKFDVLCETFFVPTQLSLDLAQGGTTLESITAHDFSGSFTGATGIQFGKDSQALGPLRRGISSLTLNAVSDPNSPVSYFRATRKGKVGKALVAIGPQVELSSTGVAQPATAVATQPAGAGAAQSPSLILISHQKNDVRLDLGSHSFEVSEGNRYILPQIESQELDSFRSTLQAKDLVMFQFSSGAGPSASATLSFRLNSPEDLPLLDAPIPLEQSVSLSFHHSLNPYLRFDDRVASGVTSDRKVDLVIELSHAKIDSIALVGKPEKSDVAMLRVTGTGSAKSVRQDGHELLPTMISEMLDRPVAERTKWLILLGALAAVFLKTIDHARGVILEHFIPKG